MQQLDQEIKAFREQMVADRRWLHQHPEVGYDLPKTLAYVRKRLEDMGYEPEECGECGLICVAGDPGAGPCIAIRGDMDALPLEEKSGVPFASKNGNMHACGHDLHTAMVLGAAQYLKNHERELKGCVKILFQPDEEATDPREILGAQDMVLAGSLENPHVDAAIGIHVCPDGIPCGTVGFFKGTVCYSVDDVEIEIKGVGAHGAQPQRGVDALNIMTHIHLALQEVLAREVDPYEACVLTFGKMGGGSAANIIPESAHMLGTLRTTNEETRRRLHERIATIAEHTATAFGGSAHTAFLRGVSSVYNDPQLADDLCRAFERKSDGEIVQLAKPFPGSDDFGTISQEVPSVYFQIGSTAAGQQGLPLHNPSVTFDESVLVKGAAFLAGTAAGWLEDHSRVNR